MRCIDCHWFTNKSGVGRAPRSCQEDGELAQTEACKRFVAIRTQGAEPTVPLEVPQTPEDVESFIGALGDVKYRDIFHEILSESFVLEQDLRISIGTIRAQLQAQGAEVTVEASQFEKYATKLIDLYVLYRLTNMTGMGAFSSQIMDIAIKRMFEQPQPSQHVVKSKG
jgi:hypothetical protein